MTDLPSSSGNFLVDLSLSRRSTNRIQLAFASPIVASHPIGMSSKQGGKLKPLKQPKSEKKEYDEADLSNIQKKKEEEKALKELRSKAAQKGAFGGTGLKKSGKK